jgi:hypothetical protein
LRAEGETNDGNLLNVFCLYTVEIQQQKKKHILQLMKTQLSANQIRAKLQHYKKKTIRNN